MFGHGVASGDPLPTSVVLWTRVTPTPEALPGSGVGPDTSVTWQVATSQAFSSIVKSGTVTTGTDRDHTVKVDATDLAPGTTYWYRFVADGQNSPIGRTRTAPADETATGKLRFGVVSCANYQAGFFSAYRHLAGQQLDAVIHLGDYIYEYANGEYGLGQGNVVVRPQQPEHEILVLDDYRQRHATYKSDPDLQTLHASAAFICTWDDHETANDAFIGGAENHDPATEGDWEARRQAAFRAYDEWMPVRMSGTSAIGDGYQLYRRFRFGQLADLSMLDLRTYRSAPGGAFDFTPIPDAPNRKIAGDEQLGWLESGLVESDAQWKLIGNPVMITPVLFPPLPNQVRDALVDFAGLLPVEGQAYNTDQWDGYTVERRRVLEFLADHGIINTVFLTGDIHSGWACELPVNPGLAPFSTNIGTELVCSSVTSNNLKDIVGAPPRSVSVGVETAIKTANRHIKYLDFDSHGYSVLEVTPSRLQMDWYVISDRADPQATAAWSTSYSVEAGTQRVQKVSAPTVGGAA